MDKKYSIDVTCLFCDTPLKGESDRNYASGDMLNCTECGELNDYDAVIGIAKEKGVALVKNNIEKELKAKFKNLFK